MRDKLVTKFTRLKNAYEKVLDEANTAIEADEFETVSEKQKEAGELRDQMKVIKSQIEELDEAESLEIEDNSEKARLPFDTTEEDDAPAGEEDNPNKDINFLRFGELDGSMKAVVSDLYGSEYSYHEKRAAQKAAFAKYLRYGETRMTSKERSLLDELVYTPDVIKSEIMQGFNVAEIKANKTDQQAAALELGGALVPEDWRADIVKRIMGMTIVRPRARNFTTVRDHIEWPKLEGGDSRYTSGVRVTWADAEIPGSATHAQTNFETGTLRIPVHTVNARTDVSMSLLEDAGVDVLDLVSMLFSEAFAIDEDEQFLTGHGGGRPKGILGNRDGANQTPDDGVGNVVSGNASALTPDGLINLSFEPDAQYLQNAVWVGAKATFRDVRKLKDGNGDYLWARGIERGAPPTLLGYDFLMDESMPAIGANNYPLIFGDLRGYAVVDRVGLTVRRVEDTVTVGRNKVALFGRRRLGGGVFTPWTIKTQKVAAS